ncbi:MAG: hypothetical protein KDE54_29765, partial [Caldilineaceae bacterium]|nr:hypothetical protein [Caldilineaceae bacterium]MCB0144347.1 hypothetical protein [Caldilineaceae bacterium]
GVRIAATKGAPDGDIYNGFGVAHWLLMVHLRNELAISALLSSRVLGAPQAEHIAFNMRRYEH